VMRNLIIILFIIDISAWKLYFSFFSKVSIYVLGLQHSVFHESNLKCHHSSLQIQKGSCSKGDHGHTHTFSGEEACGDSSAHIVVLNSKDKKESLVLNK